MRKNKLIWSIALFLIIIAALPAAYAQFSNSFTGSRLFLILINSAIVFVVLFALQSFLIPQKNDKEKTSVWVIMLLASLIVGFLYGQNGFLWQGPLGAYFNIYILVNSAIIAAVLYFALGFLKINEKLKSPEGNAGYGILIFLFSVMIAINIAPGMFLWKQEFVRSAAGFLFSSDRGILNPKSGLMVFVTSFILISFFFKGYLLKQGDQKLNYALALIFAVNLAIPPVNPIRDVIQMGEIMFILIVWETLKTTVPSDKPWAALLLAILLVGWASAALSINSPQNRGAVAQFVCSTPLINCKTETGAAAAGLFSTTKTTLYVILGGLALFWMFGGVGADKKKYSGWGIGIGLAALILIYMWNSGFGFIGKIGLVLAIMLAIIAAILYGIGRGENRRRILTLAFGGMLKRLNAIGNFARFLRATPEGREPQFFRENRLLFHAIANYTTRSEITYRYWSVVKQGSAIWKDLEEQVSKFLDQKELRHDIIVYRSGGRTSNGEEVEGWNGINLQVVDLLNDILKIIARIYVTAEFGLKDTSDNGDKGYQIEGSEFVNIKDRANIILSKIIRQEEEYKRRTKAFGAHHVLNAYKGIILNMSNVTGEVKEHPQKFARSGAEFEGNEVRSDGTAISGFYGPAFKAGGKIESEILVPIHEVNQFGEYIEDIVAQKDMFGKLDPRKYKKPRKLKNPNDIMDYPIYTGLMDNIGKDWKGLAEDIRYGLHHPMSRVVKDYTEALDKGIDYKWADNKVPFTSSPSLQNFALDMRALADPGKNLYWGRLKFDIATELGGIPPENPYPILSSLGLRDFLDIAIDRDMKDHAKAAEFKDKIPADSGVFEKDLDRGLYIGMKLSQAKAQREQGGG